MSESNVAPLHNPSWPRQRPPASPPSCFSQLYALNQCYDDILMMQQILQKVICDMAANNAEFQQCLVDGIMKSGSNVPLIGVTNGADAQPGQVGQYAQFSSPVNYAAGDSTNMVSLGVLEPGDWDCWMWWGTATEANSFAIGLNPIPAGFTNDVFSAQYGATPAVESSGSTIARALISVPTLIAYQVVVGGAVAAGTLELYFAARRRR